MKEGKIDRLMLWIIGGLLFLGLSTLASASFSLSTKDYGAPLTIFYRQIIFGVGVGLILFWVGLRIPVALYRKYAPLILISALFLAALVLIPGIGVVHGGARRWLSIGGMTFQPSEALKLAFVIYLSSWMASRQKVLGTWREGFFPFIVITGVVGVFIYLEPDIGTLGVFALTALALFFVGGGKVSQIFFGVFLGALLLSLIIYFEPYRRDRVLAFFYPEQYGQSKSWQLNQALIAIGSGGLFGHGLGYSRQKFQYLPEPAGDAIFAVYAEELGFFGVLILFALFIAFFLRGMLIAARARDIFSKLLASGITLFVVVQILVNIAAISRSFLLTGIPLPFMSQGGSALAFLLFEMGILLHISRRTTGT